LTDAAMAPLVIFDCDGVLVDSEPISNRVMAAAIKRLGVEMSVVEVTAAFQGRRLDEMAAEIGARLGGPVSADWLEEFEAERAQAFADELGPVDGVEDVLRELRRLRVPRCVASQARPQKVELTLAITGLRTFFAEDAIFSASMVPRPKPDPDLFLLAATSMGFRPQDCVVVEDGALGVLAAKAAKMPVLGYGEGPAAAALKRAGAEVFSAMSELLPRLGLS
jgi:HAD superfamily hydrolase (TIGR01509 family)